MSPLIIAGGSLNSPRHYVPVSMASEADGSDLGDRIEALQRRLSRTWELFQGSTLDVRPFRPGDDGPLASFTVPEDEREVDRYWVNAPYAYVVITYDDAESEHRY